MKFKTAKSLATYERVLAAAEQLFQKQGYDATTMRDLARESQLGLGALYYYFKSKEELVLTFYEQINQQCSQQFQAQLPGYHSLDEALRQFLKLKLALLEPRRGLLRVILKEAVDPDSPLCPLHPASRVALDSSLGIFQEMAGRLEGLKGKEQVQRARFLWLAHMGVLNYWLHDRTAGFRATYAVVDTLLSFLKLASLAARIPGMKGLQNRLRSHVDDLFEGGAGEVCPELV